jgi:alkylhydroperoxidase/carboxymuconolactone decarboxylase family protein YurZ
MTDDRPSEAWVSMPSNEALAAMRPAGVAPGARHPYDFGFMPAMARLAIAHPRIGAQFLALFQQIMFAPGRLDRREREMVAAVTAAAQDCRY